MVVMVGPQMRMKGWLEVSVRWRMLKAGIQTQRFVFDLVDRELDAEIKKSPCLLIVCSN